MTREEMEFIRSLNFDQLYILKGLLQQRQNNLEAGSYIELLLSGSDLSCNVIELLKNIVKLISIFQRKLQLKP